RFLPLDRQGLRRAGQFAVRVVLIRGRVGDLMKPVLVPRVLLNTLVSVIRYADVEQVMVFVVKPIDERDNVVLGLGTLDGGWGEGALHEIVGVFIWDEGGTKSDVPSPPINCGVADATVVVDVQGGAAS